MFFIECLLADFQKEASSTKTDKLDPEGANYDLGV